MVNIQIEHVFLSIYIYTHVVLFHTRTFTILRELQGLIVRCESRSCSRIWDLRLISALSGILVFNTMGGLSGMLLHLACSVANTNWFPGPGHMPLLALSSWRLKVDDQTQTLRTRRHETSKLLLTRGDPFAPPWLL